MAFTDHCFSLNCNVDNYHLKWGIRSTMVPFRVYFLQLKVLLEMGLEHNLPDMVLFESPCLGLLTIPPPSPQPLVPHAHMLNASLYPEDQQVVITGDIPVHIHLPTPGLIHTAWGPQTGSRGIHGVTCVSSEWYLGCYLSEWYLRCYLCE